MARSQRHLPYFLDRFGYWHLPIAASFRTPAAWGPQPPPSALESQDETITHVLAIRDGQDSPEPLDPRSAHERHAQALAYWIESDRLWYQFGLAQDLLDTLPAHQQEALYALSQQRWAPRRSRWTWDTLLPRIAKDQRIFQKIVKLGPTRAGVVATSDPASRTIAHDLFGETQATVHKIYVAYRRQSSLLLGVGTRPSKDLATWWHDASALDRRGRLHPDAVLTDIEEVRHWFAHALRNLTRYRNSHPPLPWSDNPTSCASRCQRALENFAR